MGFSICVCDIVSREATSLFLCRGFRRGTAIDWAHASTTSIRGVASSVKVSRHLLEVAGSPFCLPEPFSPTRALTMYIRCKDRYPEVQWDVAPLASCVPTSCLVDHPPLAPAPARHTW